MQHRLTAWYYLTACWCVHSLTAWCVHCLTAWCVQGSKGSWGSHWEKRIIGNEYMSAIANEITYPISQITLALFEDMGFWGVDYSQVAAHTVAAAAALTTATAAVEVAAVAVAVAVAVAGVAGTN